MHAHAWQQVQVRPRASDSTEDSGKHRLEIAGGVPGLERSAGSTSQPSCRWRLLWHVCMIACLS